MIKRAGGFLALLSIAMLLMGASCSPKSARPSKFDLRFSVDAVLSGASIQVDVMGANTITDLPRLESYSVSEYWKPGNALRRDSAKAVLKFGPGLEAVQTLSSADPMWNTWLRTGAGVLVIFVDLPGTQSDRPGLADPRRLIVSIDQNEWGRVRTLEFVIQESGVRLITARPIK